MSYILEALRKADQQRRLGDVPGLDAAQPVEVPVRQNRIWGWVLLGVMNLVLLAVLFWPDAEQKVKEVALENDNNSEITSRPEKVPSPQVKPYRPPVPVSATEAPQHKRTEGRDIVPPLRTIPPPPLTPKKVRPGSVAQAETPIEPETVEIAQVEDSADIPVWPQVSARLLGQLGAGLRLDVHVYADRPEERFVLINLQKYREGDRLAEGPTLEEVTPDGAVMSFEGERFRITAN